MPTLNERAHKLANAMAADADALGITVSTLPCGTRIIDCGIKAPGSIEAGRRLAEVCMSALGSVRIQDSEYDQSDGSFVHVTTNEPVIACMASQYAGWEIKSEKFFAMGSGPMRAAACREELFKDIGHCERPPVCVGVLETSKLPTEQVCLEIAEKCRVDPGRLTFLAARTACICGTVQIVARSVETALHKLHLLGFDLSRVNHAFGSAPLPPVASDDLTAVGWTNDAILYGGVVAIFVHGDDKSLFEIGARVPSNASPDYGRPFAEIFKRYDGDFYRIDPMLFSPAQVALFNIDTKNQLQFGECAPHLLAESFAKK